MINTSWLWLCTYFVASPGWCRHYGKWTFLIIFSQKYKCFIRIAGLSIQLPEDKLLGWQLRCQSHGILFWYWKKLWRVNGPTKWWITLCHFHTRPPNRQADTVLVIRVSLVHGPCLGGGLWVKGKMALPIRPFSLDTASASSHDFTANKALALVAEVEMLNFGALA